MGYCYKNNVAGVSEENFDIPVNAYINGKDLCTAVERCLAAERENNHHHHHHCHCRWNRCKY